MLNLHCSPLDFVLIKTLDKKNSSAEWNETTYSSLDFLPFENSRPRCRGLLPLDSKLSHFKYFHLDAQVIYPCQFTSSLCDYFLENNFIKACSTTKFAIKLKIMSAWQHFSVANSDKLHHNYLRSSIVINKMLLQHIFYPFNHNEVLFASHGKLLRNRIIIIEVKPWRSLLPNLIWRPY